LAVARRAVDLARWFAGDPAGGLAVLDIEVTTGEINEGQVVLERIDAVAATTGTPVRTITADAGYAYAKVYGGLERREIEAVIPAKAELIKSPVPLRCFRYDAKHDILILKIDTLKFAQTLTAAGMDRGQAEAIARAISEADTSDLATKADVAELKAATGQDIAELKAATGQDIAELKAVTRQDIADLRAELKADIARLEEKMDTTIAELKAEVIPLHVPAGRRHRRPDGRADQAAALIWAPGERFGNTTVQPVDNYAVNTLSQLYQRLDRGPVVPWSRGPAV
jgi:hypothetical protein